MQCGTAPGVYAEAALSAHHCSPNLSLLFFGIASLEYWVFENWESVEVLEEEEDESDVMLLYCEKYCFLTLLKMLLLMSIFSAFSGAFDLPIYPAGTITFWSCLLLMFNWTVFLGIQPWNHKSQTLKNSFSTLLLALFFKILEWNGLLIPLPSVLFLLLFVSWWLNVIYVHRRTWSINSYKFFKL